jgi:hypothetical protein
VRRTERPAPRSSRPSTPRTKQEQELVARKAEWSKEAYETSVSSRCWWYTPYDDGWDRCPRLSADDELRQIVEMERELGPVPEWAQQVVERSIKSACPCGHYLFPQPYLEVLEAIGDETPPTFVHSCFTVERDWKRQMIDYVFCLDAWLAGAGPDDASRELMALGHRRVEWDTVCTDLWRTLGAHTELKNLLIERLIHSQRLKIKESPWDDDPASEFGRDQFLGPMSARENPAKVYCHIEQEVPGYGEGRSPRVQRLEARLAELCPDWDKMRYHINFGWLCSPRAFRFLERLVWAIGQERAPRPDDRVPGFLQIDDTHPNQDQAPAWWQAFCHALDGWWRGKPGTGAVADEVNRFLGEDAPAKRWLVRLFLKKLRHLERNGEGLTKLVKPPPGSKRGSRPVP